MTISKEEREAIIDGVHPESVTENQVNKISMGIYDDEVLRGKAIDSLIEISRAAPNKITETAAKSLTDALTHEEPMTRSQAGRAITNFCRTNPAEFEEAVPTIINILTDDSRRYVQRRAAETIDAISQQKPELLTEELSNLTSVIDDDSLHNDEIAKREAVVTALGNVGCATDDHSQLVVAEVAEALDDPWKDVREASIDALSTIGTERPDDVADVLPEIVNLIRDSEEAPGVRIAGVDAIEEIGKERPGLISEIRPELVDVLPDKEAERPDAVERATAVYADGETQVQARIMSFLEN